MRRVEDKIRSLCTQVLTTKDDAELRSKLVELRDALHQHIERLRGRLFEYPVVLERREREQNRIPLPDPPTPDNATERSTTTIAKP
jgi:hypothetical protein